MSNLCNRQTLRVGLPLLGRQLWASLSAVFIVVFQVIALFAFLGMAWLSVGTTFMALSYVFGVAPHKFVDWVKPISLWLGAEQHIGWLAWGWLALVGLLVLGVLLAWACDLGREALASPPDTPAPPSAED